jgi:hypothetical protein
VQRGEGVYSSILNVSLPSLGSIGKDVEELFANSSGRSKNGKEAFLCEFTRKCKRKPKNPRGQTGFFAGKTKK